MYYVQSTIRFYSRLVHTSPYLSLSFFHQSTYCPMLISKDTHTLPLAYVHTFPLAQLQLLFVILIFTLSFYLSIICLSSYLSIYLLTYLSIYLPIFLSIYIPIFLSTYLSFYLPTYLSIYLHTYLSIYLHTYLSIYLPIFLSIYLPIFLSIYIPIFLSTYLHIFLSIYIPIFLSTYLHVFLSNYLSIYLHTCSFPSLSPHPFSAHFCTCVSCHLTKTLHRMSSRSLVLINKPLTTREDRIAINMTRHLVGVTMIGRSVIQTFHLSFTGAFPASFLFLFVPFKQLLQK